MIRPTMGTKTKNDSQKRRHSRIGVITLALFFWSLLLPGAMAADPSTIKYKQIIPIKATAEERQIYTFENGFLLVSRFQNAEGTEKDLIFEKLDKNGKKQEVSSIIHQAGEKEVKYVQSIQSDTVIIVGSSGAESTYLLMFRLDSTGKPRWERYLPLKKLCAMKPTNDQGMIIIGAKNSSGENLIALKIDANGSWNGSSQDASKWETTVGSSNNCQINSIVQVLDEDGYNDGYVLAGSKDMGGSKQKDVLTIRLDSFGKLRWLKTSGRAGNDEAYSVTPMYDDSDVVDGYAVAGYCERSGGREMYLLHLDLSGNLTRWPGLDRSIDGEAEKFYGSGYNTTGLAVYPVPSSFKEGRTINSKEYDGDGGIIAVGLQEVGSQKRLLLARVTEKGRDKWKFEMEIPGNYLMLGENNQDKSDSMNVAYSSIVPADLQQSITINTLELYLDKTNQQDKTMSQSKVDDQNSEEIKWQKRSIKYEQSDAKKDRSQDIKNLLAQQKTTAQTSPRSGWGEIEWPSKSYYLGNIRVGKADGQGTMLFESGVWYKGSWSNNMFNGNGMLRFPTGEYYQGGFKDNMLHGKGVLVWPTGEKYEGDFFNGYMQGQGKLSWSGGKYYQGGFNLDLADGMGTVSWPNGERYEGQMQKGQPSGQGSYYFANGEWYKGEMKNLVFEGVGVYHWPDGSYYVGEFKDDRLYGEGYYVWPNGVQQWGYWKNDHYLGMDKDTLDNYIKSKS